MWQYVTNYFNLYFDFIGFFMRDGDVERKLQLMGGDLALVTTREK